MTVPSRPCTAGPDRDLRLLAGAKRLVRSWRVRRALRHLATGDWRSASRTLNRKFDGPSEPPRAIAPAPLIERSLIVAVVPCYNHGGVVGRAVESLLRQTLPPDEIIVVDSGSADPRGLDELERLRHPGTRILRRAERHLVGDNRNWGIEAAGSSRYICCLDADDTLAPDYLEKAVFLLETFLFDIVSTSALFVGEREGGYDVLPRPLLSQMITGNHVTSCAVFRRRLWEEHGGFVDSGIDNEHVAEDWDLWLRFAAHGARIRNIREPLLRYTVSSQSLSNNARVPPLSEQRDRILARNRELVTAKALSLSLARAETNPVSTVPGGVMREGQAKRRRSSKSRHLVITLPFLIIGGAERLLSSIAAGMVSRGWHVTVVATEVPPASGGNAADWFRDAGAEVFDLPCFLDPGEFRLFLDYLFATRLPNCVLNAGSVLFYEMASELARYGAAYADLLFNTTGHTQRHAAHKDLFAMALCEGKAVEEWYKASGWSPARIRKIASAVDAIGYVARGRAEVARANLGIPPEDIVVGFSGRLSPEKGIDTLMSIVERCAHLRNVHFVLTGSGPMASYVESRLARLKSRRVHYLGIVDNIEDHLALYDILLGPSHLDGRPLVILEALSAGTAILASDVGGISEMFEDGVEGYLCDPSRAEDFAARISELVAQPELLARLKQAASRRRETASSDTMILAYEAALLHAIEWGGSTPPHAAKSHRENRRPE